MSSFVANSAVMHLQFLFRELRNGRGSSFDGMVWVVTEVEDGFSYWVEYSGEHTFYSDTSSGFHDGGQWYVHGGESCQWSLGEGGVLFLLSLFWVEGIREKDVVKGSITLSFNQKVGVVVQLSFNLLGHESVLL